MLGCFRVRHLQWIPPCGRNPRITWSWRFSSVHQLGSNTKIIVSLCPGPTRAAKLTQSLHRGTGLPCSGQSRPPSSQSPIPEPCLVTGRKRSKDIAALAVELGCAQILVLRDHQITRDSRDSEGVPGSYNHPQRGGRCLVPAWSKISNALKRSGFRSRNFLRTAAF